MSYSHIHLISMKEQEHGIGGGLHRDVYGIGLKLISYGSITLHLFLFIDHQETALIVSSTMQSMSTIKHKDLECVDAELFCSHAHLLDVFTLDRCQVVAVILPKECSTSFTVVLVHLLLDLPQSSCLRSVPASRG